MAYIKIPIQLGSTVDGRNPNQPPRMNQILFYSVG